MYKMIFIISKIVYLKLGLMSLTICAIRFYTKTIEMCLNNVDFLAYLMVEDLLYFRMINVSKLLKLRH